jgi:alanine racemase
VSSLRWAEIDLGAISANCARILGHLPKGAQLFAVVKAGGYGHGAVPVAHAALEGGAAGLAVATLEEAGQLRGLVDPGQILVMGGLLPSQAGDAVASGCSIAVSSRELADALAATGSERTVPVHLKIDTGMGRFGCAPEEAPGLAQLIEESKGTTLAGTWTHFAKSESDDAMTRRQFEVFLDVVSRFEVGPGMRHACNSAGARLHPDFALEAVRCGISIYGCEWPGTQPALALRSKVTHLKTAQKGATVGYGSLWRAEGATRVATVAIGYADGVHRARANRGHALVRGRRAPLIGMVSMDAITLDVTDVPGVELGDTATLIGRDGDETITAEQAAEWSSTISYEVLTSLGPRVERRFSSPAAGEVGRRPRADR